MTSSVVVLERGLSIPKQVWRGSSCRRTLAPIPFESVIVKLWQANQSELPERGVMVASLLPDGSQDRAVAIRAIQGPQKALAGVFDVSYLSEDSVRVTLREEKRLARLGIPRRRTCTIAVLRPWMPIRVLLNGRYSSYAGQLYLVQEYCLALCANPVPDALRKARLIDRQADLL